MPKLRPHRGGGPTRAQQMMAIFDRAAKLGYTKVAFGRLLGVEKNNVNYWAVQARQDDVDPRLPRPKWGCQPSRAVLAVARGFDFATALDEEQKLKVSPLPDGRAEKVLWLHAHAVRFSGVSTEQFLDAIGSTIHDFHRWRRRAAWRAAGGGGLDVPPADSGDPSRSVLAAAEAIFAPPGGYDPSADVWKEEWETTEE